MTVLITGASSGIGEACAKIFAAANYDLILMARREERLLELARQLRQSHSVQIAVFPCDVQDKKAVSRVFAENWEAFRKIEILINNAGLARGREPIQTCRLEDWDEMIDTNIKGLLYVTRAIVPQMIENKKGHIIQIGSVAGHWTYPNGNVYCATKAAVHSLTQGMRMDLKGTPIRVSEISPGMVQTEFSAVRFHGDQTKAQAVYEGKKPLSAMDVAEAVLWCAQRPANVNIQEIVLFPTEQASV